MIDKPGAVGETDKIEESAGSRLPKKWNLIFGATEGQADGSANIINHPEPQPNQRERSESLPCVPTPRPMEPWGRKEALSTLSEMDETKPKAKTTDDEFSSTLYKAIWKTLDGSMATSPVRSPVVADWKVVGSPSGSIQKIVDPLDLLLEDEARLRDGSGSLSGISSVDRSRRLRSASVIGELLHSGSSDIFNSSAASPEPTEKRSGGVDGQVAQLPTMLHADLGLENEAEATEIFKRSSMESILDDLGGEGEAASPAGSCATDFFKNITFGPLANAVFPSAGASSGSLNSASSVGGLDKRRPSYLGLTDWPLSAGAIGTGRPDYFVDETSVDDYFSGNAIKPWNIPGSQRISRRHSLVAPEGGTIEEHFSNMGFGSVPKGSSPPKLYLPTGNNNNGGGSYAGHSSMATNGYYDDGELFDEYHSVGPGSNHHHSHQHHHHPRSNDPPFQLSSYVGPLWAVEFKSGRTEIFYVLEVDGEAETKCSVGDLVIVEADRGEDLGRITAEISVAKMRSCIAGSDEDVAATSNSTGGSSGDKNEISSELAALLRSKEIIPKRIHRLAQNSDLKMLQAKAQEEALAMVRCQSRIRQKKLPMDVVDAEYQWDRNKLTFYFIADRRIDFRELVRDLFRIYKTRIWMCAVDKTSPRMINYLGGLVPVHTNMPSDINTGDPLVTPNDAAKATSCTVSYKSVASHEAD